MISSIKQKTSFIKSEIYRSDQSKISSNFLEEKNDIKCEDIEQYIIKLKQIKKSLSIQSNSIQKNDIVYSKVRSRREQIIKTLDENGLALNTRLQSIISSMGQKEHDLGDKINSVSDKIDSRAAIKENCCEIDSKVTALAESTTNKAELLLKDLVRVIQYKNTLKGTLSKLSMAVEESKIVARGNELEKTVMSQEAKDL